MNVTQVQLIRWLDRLTLNDLSRLRFNLTKYIMCLHDYQDQRSSANLEALALAYRDLHGVLSDLMGAR